MELWIVRHAPAEESDPVRWPDDDDRPLTSPGAELVRALAPALVRRTGTPRPIASSPALRARATAELLRPHLAPRGVVEVWEELAPGARPEPVLARLATPAAGTPRLPVLVGHAPTLNELVGLAVEGRPGELARIPRGGAALVTFARKVAAGQGRLKGVWEAEALIEADRASR